MTECGTSNVTEAAVCRGRKRQEVKERNRLFKDMYFLIQWMEEEEGDLFDVIPARSITSLDGADVLDLLPGDECKASFGSTLYHARVVALGKYTEMKRKQKEKEKEAEEKDIEGDVDSCGGDIFEGSSYEGEALVMVQTGGQDKGEDIGKLKPGSNEDVQENSAVIPRVPTHKSSKVTQKKGTGNEGGTGKQSGSKSGREENCSKGSTKTPAVTPSAQKQPKATDKGGDGKQSCNKGGREENSNKDLIKAPAVTPSTQKQPKATDKGGEGIRSCNKGGREQHCNKDSTKTPGVTPSSHKQPKATGKKGMGRESLTSGGVGKQSGNKGDTSNSGENCRKDSRKSIGVISPLHTYDGGSESDANEAEMAGEDPTPFLTPKRNKKRKSKKSSPRKKIPISSSDSEEDCLSSPAKKKQKRMEMELDHSASEEEPLSCLEAKRIRNIAENEMFKKMIGLGPSMSSNTITTEVTKLKEKVRVLEKSQIKLKRKLSEQEAEINLLRRVTSSEMSSSVEATPTEHVRGPFATRFPKMYNSPRPTEPELPGVDPVRLANAKLQPDANSAALKLMDCVFSTEELVNANPSGVTRSKDETRQRTIRPLDGAKMRYIDSVLQEKWGLTTSDKTIRRKMTQKCTDYFSDPRYKHLRLS